MTDNGTIEISVGGKLVQLTPQQIAVVSQKIQEKYGEALDGARSAIVKAVEGCPTTIDYSKSGNVRTQVQLPKGVSCYMGQLYFNHTAMDSASRNAGELVDKLTINYNRSRQAAITKELIEIISGAESL